MREKTRRKRPLQIWEIREIRIALSGRLAELGNGGAL
jgi:hypothetical protein